MGAGEGSGADDAGDIGWYARGCREVETKVRLGWLGGAMIRSELVQRIQEENPHLLYRHAESIVDAVFEEIEQALCSGHRVELRGFGTFEVRVREERIGRNPRSGEKVLVARKYVPFFRAGKKLIARMNGHG